jgi:OmpA-OmpF porin, OOP family
MSEKRSPGSLVKLANSFGAVSLLALLAAASAPALAQHTDAGNVSGMALPSGGWYGGLSAGRSQLGIRDTLLPVSGARLSQLSEDDSTAGYKLYGGYQFNRHITLEGGYADFGKLEAQRESAAPMLGSMSNNFRTSAFYVGAVGIIPLPNRFSLFGKLGTTYATGASPVSASGVLLPLLTPADPNPRRTEWNSKYGLGASYEMSNKLGLRFEYERSNSLGDGRIGEGNIGMWSLGLTKRY